MGSAFSKSKVAPAAVEPKAQAAQAHAGAKQAFVNDAAAPRLPAAGGNSASMASTTASTTAGGSGLSAAAAAAVDAAGAVGSATNPHPLAQTSGEWHSMMLSGEVDGMMVHEGGLKGLKIRQDLVSIASSDEDEAEEDGEAEEGWLQSQEYDIEDLKKEYANNMLLEEGINDLLVRTDAVKGLRMRAEEEDSSDSDSEDGSIDSAWLDKEEEETTPSGGDDEIQVTVSELYEEGDWTEWRTLAAVFSRAGLDESQMHRIKQLLEPCKYNSGDYIVRQGEVGDKFYIITAGEVAVSRKADNSAEDKIVTHLYQGHFFGETSLYCQAPRNASIRAVGAVQCMSLSKDSFDTLVKESESFRSMMDKLVTKKRKTAQRRDELASSVQRHVAPEERKDDVKISKLTRFGRTKDKKTVINDYVVINELGKGSYGIVHLSLCLSNAKLYAMKMLDLAQFRKKVLNVSDEELMKEVAVMKRLQNPNVVELYEVISDPKNDKVYLVQEFMRDGALMPDEEHSEPIPLGKARKYFRDVLQGLDYLHFQGVIHRDIKPGNIFLAQESADKTHAKLGDFGSAAILKSRSDDTLTEVRGTPAFWAPELFAENLTSFSGFAVDMWALGVTLYQMVVGQPPFMANTELKMAEKVRNEEPPVSPTVEANPHLRNLLKRLLCKDPKQRITLREAMEHAWVTDEGSDPLAVVSHIRVSLNAKSVKSVSTPVVLKPDGAAVVAGAGAGAGSGAGAGAGSGGADGIQRSTSQRPSITQGIGVDADGNPMQLPEDVIPVTEETDSPATPHQDFQARNRRESPWQRGGMPLRSSSEQSLSQGAGSTAGKSKPGSLSRLPSAQRQFRATASSMSLRSGHTYTMANAASTDGVARMRHLQGVKNALAKTTMSDQDKDKILERLRGEHWVSMFPTHRSMEFTEVKMHGSGRSAAAAMKANATPRTASAIVVTEAAGEAGSGAGAGAGANTSPRLVSHHGSMPEAKVMKRLGSLRRAADFVMLSSPTSSTTSSRGSTMHSVMLRPEQHTFSITGEALRISTADDHTLTQVSDTESDDELEEETLVEAADDLDAIFDPLADVAEVDDPELDALDAATADVFQRARTGLLATTGNARMKLVAAAASDTGGYNTMEDRAYVNVNFSKEYGVEGCDVAAFGVFDGHHGASTAQYIVEHMPQDTAQQPELLSNTPAALKKAFLQLDKRLVDAAPKWLNDSGSTANLITVMQRADGSGPDVFCANVGDSRAVMSRGGEALDLSIDHKVTNEDEVARIRSTGGFLAKGGRLFGHLAVARSIGDIGFKGRFIREAYPDSVFVGEPLSAEPEVAQEKLQPNDEFIIIASDGLWDVLSSQQAVNLVRRSLVLHRNVDRAAKELVDKAVARCTIDNVSAVLICFHQ